MVPCFDSTVPAFGCWNKKRKTIYCGVRGIILPHDGSLQLRKFIRPYVFINLARCPTRKTYWNTNAFCVVSLDSKLTALQRIAPPQRLLILRLHLAHKIIERRDQLSIHVQNLENKDQYIWTQIG